MSAPATVTFQTHQDEFSFLGIENIVTDSANFGHFWDNFFKLGGYDKISLYAIDPKPINVWYTNSTGEKIYFQGLMVKDVGEVPEGYTLKNFPASDFIVVTHDWLPTYSEAQGYGIDAGWKNIKTVEITDGYIRNDGEGSPLTVIERDNHDTPYGSRIEFWVPIKKKPRTIEEQIGHVLTGDAQKNALDFIAFLQANKISLDSNGDNEGWAVGGIVGESIGFMLVNGAPDCPGPWTMWFNSCDFGDGGNINDDLKETVWAHASPCGKCHAGWEDCGGGNRTIFGREFERLCHSPLMFTNPGGKTLENMKKLILILT